ncbi:MAG: hypothetical protein QM578_18575, partial [Pantoea sp.]|uniref:hypothetical protein n=1 Tax=Pantoea sp. TaxID=69393 RepID=UPI0039E33A47
KAPFLPPSFPDAPHMLFLYQHPIYHMLCSCENPSRASKRSGSSLFRIPVEKESHDCDEHRDDGIKQKPML